MNLNPQNNNSQEQEFTVNQQDMDVQKKFKFYEDLENFKEIKRSREAVLARYK